MVGHPDEIDFQHGDGSEFLNVVITSKQFTYIGCMCMHIPYGFTMIHIPYTYI